MSDVGVMMKYDAMKKSMLLAYLLWWFLGFFGAHRFYMGRTNSAVWMLVLGLAALPLTLIIIGWLMMAGVFAWWVVDAFQIPSWVRSANMRLAQALDPGHVPPPTAF